MTPLCPSTTTLSTPRDVDNVVVEGHSGVICHSEQFYVISKLHVISSDTDALWPVEHLLTCWTPSDLWQPLTCVGNSSLGFGGIQEQCILDDHCDTVQNLAEIDPVVRWHNIAILRSCWSQLHIIWILVVLNMVWYWQMTSLPGDTYLPNMSRMV